MDLKEILTYLNIEEDQKDKVKVFFEQPCIKDFLLNKWEDFCKEPIPLPVEQNEEEQTPLEIKTEEAESIELIDQNATSEKDITMAFIPNIPDDGDTRSRQQSNRKYSDPRDQELYLKLTSKHIQLKNGKVNQPYQDLFDITNFGIADIGYFEFDGLEEIGLKYTFKTDLIEGIPTKAGDHKITLRCYRSQWIDGEPTFERPITLIVNPDPQSLWNNIPTPTDVEYYKPDCDCDYVEVEATKGFLGMGKKECKDIVAASQRGRSHAHEGNARDDDFSIQFLDENQWYLLTVADGAGSAKYARKGAQIACETVAEVCSSQLVKYSKEIDELISDFDKDASDAKRKKLGDALYNIIGSAAFKAYKNIEKEAQDKGAQIKDYSTTLLTTVAKKFKFGWFIAAFWVGDGGIGIYNKETQYLKILGEPDSGEFAGQTRFLTMTEVMQPAEIYRRLRFEIVEDFTALILMTDGVTDPKFETDSNLQKVEKWNSLWLETTAAINLTDGNTEAKNELMKWLNFWSPGNHDDRTMAILY